MSNEDPYEGKVSWWKVTEKIIRYIMKKIRKYRDENINPILENEKYTEEEKKEKLVDQLRRIRFCYNMWNGFSSNFVFAFLFGLIGLLVGQAKNISVDGKVNILNMGIINLFSVNNKIGNVEPNIAILAFIGGFFLVILLCQWFFLRNANIYYEEMEVVKAELEKIKESKSKCEEMKVSEAELNEMKLIKAELEKINNTIQPNPKKTSIRIYKRNSVRRSIFGR